MEKLNFTKIEERKKEREIERKKEIQRHKLRLNKTITQ